MKRSLITTITLLQSLLISTCLAMPQSLIVGETTTTTEPTTLPAKVEEDDGQEPFIEEMKIDSTIQFRYARTVVQSYIKNPSNLAKEAGFNFILPETAFISNFSMTIGGEEYVAEVAEKEEAKERYQEAVASGQGAGLVDQDVREANVFNVHTNIESGGKVRFRLVYEELLERKLGKYEHAIHVNPGQVVNGGIKVTVHISESRPLVGVEAPGIDGSENDISKSTKFQSFSPSISIGKEQNTANVTFSLDDKEQKKINSQDGVSGEFIVRYDVDRKDDLKDGKAGEVQILDGYFVHFFAPDSLPTLPKHVVFVLDVSGSMSGTKLEQTKDAMVTIMDDLGKDDYFNIITFSTGVEHWRPLNEKLLEGKINQVLSIKDY